MVTRFIIFPVQKVPLSYTMEPLEKKCSKHINGKTKSIKMATKCEKGLGAFSHEFHDAVNIGVDYRSTILLHVVV